MQSDTQKRRAAEESITNRGQESDEERSRTQRHQRPRLLFKVHSDVLSQRVRGVARGSRESH